MTTLKASLIANAVLFTATAWLIGFNADHMKHRAIVSITDTLDTVSASLKETKKVAAPHDMTMPPVLDVSDLKRMDEINEYKADVIAAILQGN